MGHARPHRRKDKAHQIWPLRADPELSPSDGAGLGHRNARADSTRTPDGGLRHRLYRPCGDGQEAFEPRGRTHIAQVKALLRGDIADIDGGLAQILASDGWLPDRPINVPIYMAGQGPKARALAREIADGLISLGGPAEGFETCLVSTGGTVLDDGEDVTSPRASSPVKPLVALAYHLRYTTDPESVKALPNGEAWLASVERADENPPSLRSPRSFPRHFKRP
jgi:hypothetical protein